MHFIDIRPVRVELLHSDNRRTDGPGGGERERERGRGGERERLYETKSNFPQFWERASKPKSEQRSKYTANNVSGDEDNLLLNVVRSVTVAVN
jgi:hypothetical protein